MVSWACRAFRARFTPGLSGSLGPLLGHRLRCRECAAYARALELAAAGARSAPLSAALRARLTAIHTPATPAVAAPSVGRPPTTGRQGADGRVLRMAERSRLPQLPLPKELGARLRALPLQEDRAHAVPLRTPEPRRLPFLLQSPRYLVAASYLLTVLTVALFGNPARLGDRAATGLDAHLPALLERLGSTIERAARGFDSDLDDLTGAPRPASINRDRGPARPAGGPNR